MLGANLEIPRGSKRGALLVHGFDIDLKFYAKICSISDMYHTTVQLNKNNTVKATFCQTYGCSPLLRRFLLSLPCIFKSVLDGLNCKLIYCFEYYWDIFYEPPITALQKLRYFLSRILCYCCSLSLRHLWRQIGVGDLFNPPRRIYFWCPLGFRTWLLRSKGSNCWFSSL